MFGCIIDMLVGDSEILNKKPTTIVKEVVREPRTPKISNGMPHISNNPRKLNKKELDYINNKENLTEGDRLSLRDHYYCIGLEYQNKQN